MPILPLRCAAYPSSAKVFKHREETIVKMNVMTNIFIFILQCISQILRITINSLMSYEIEVQIDQ